MLLVLSVVLYVVFCVVLAICGMAIVTIAGLTLRTVHLEAAKLPEFGVIRQHGLWLGCGKLLRHARRIPGRLARDRAARRAATGMMLAPLIGFAAPHIPFWFIGLFLTDGVKNGPVGASIGAALTAWGFVGLVLATWVWLRGLAYIARQRIVLPIGMRKISIALPSDLDQQARDRLSVDTFWMLQLGKARMLAAVYPFVTMAIAASALATVAPVNGTSPLSVPEDPPAIVNMLLLFVVLLPGLIPAALVTRHIRRRLAATEAAVMIMAFRQGDQASTSAVANDPEHGDTTGEATRGILTDISDLLIESACQLERGQDRKHGLHPKATVFRAVAQRIGIHLESRRALGDTIPENLDESLRLTVAVIAGAGGPATVEALAESAAAFDADGVPTAGRPEKVPGHAARFFTWLTSTTHGLAFLLTNIVAIVVAVRELT